MILLQRRRHWHGFLSIFLFYGRQILYVRRIGEAALRDSVTRFFASGFFRESSSPKPMKSACGSIQIFQTFAEIFASQGAPPVSTTPVLKKFDKFSVLKLF